MTVFFLKQNRFWKHTILQICIGRFPGHLLGVSQQATKQQSKKKPGCPKNSTIISMSKVCQLVLSTHVHLNYVLNSMGMYKQVFMDIWEKWIFKDTFFQKKRNPIQMTSSLRRITEHFGWFLATDNIEGGRHPQIQSLTWAYPQNSEHD